MNNRYIRPSLRFRKQVANKKKHQNSLTQQQLVTSNYKHLPVIILDYVSGDLVKHVLLVSIHSWFRHINSVGKNSSPCGLPHPLVVFLSTITIADWPGYFMSVPNYRNQKSTRSTTFNGVLPANKDMFFGREFTSTYLAKQSGHRKLTLRCLKLIVSGAWVRLTRG